MPRTSSLRVRPVRGPRLRPADHRALRPALAPGDRPAARSGRGRPAQHPARAPRGRRRAPCARCACSASPTFCARRRVRLDDPPFEPARPLPAAGRARAAPRLRRPGRARVRLEGALPRAWVVGAQRVVPRRRRALDAVTDPASTRAAWRSPSSGCGLPEAAGAGRAPAGARGTPTRTSASSSAREAAPGAAGPGRHVLPGVEGDSGRPRSRRSSACDYLSAGCGWAPASTRWSSATSRRAGGSAGSCRSSRCALGSRCSRWGLRRRGSGGAWSTTAGARPAQEFANRPSRPRSGTSCAG